MSTKPRQAAESIRGSQGLIDELGAVPSRGRRRTIASRLGTRTSRTRRVGHSLVTPEDTQDQSLELVVGVLQPLGAQENVPDRLVERAFFQALPKGFFNQGR